MSDDDWIGVLCCVGYLLVVFAFVSALVALVLTATPGGCDGRADPAARPCSGASSYPIQAAVG